MAERQPRRQPGEDVPSLLEPVEVTIVHSSQMRDLRKIGFKLKYAILPQAADEQTRQLRDWDLWGPLVICILLAFTLSVSGGGGLPSEESGSIAFGLVFTIVWVGASVVTLNAQLLGSTMYPPPRSFFQSVCALGYCLFPVTVGAVIGRILGSNVLLVKLLCVSAGCGWSIKAAFGFTEHLTPPKRWKLAAYPVLLFYIVLAWFVMLV